MRKISTLLFAAVFALLTVGDAFALNAAQDQNANTATTNTPRKLRSPRSRRHRRRHVRSETRRSTGSVGRNYANGGRSLARGTKGFGKNVAKGHLKSAGKDMGQGAGEFGKDVGKGTANAAKKGAHVTVKGVKKVKNTVTQ